MAFLPVEEQLKRIESGIEELIPREEFRERLERATREGRPLRVKQGFDPTAPDIHLGHTVGLRKLRQFQDLGHQVVLIVGTGTGIIGDPSGRSATRPQLSLEELEANARTYLAQFFRVLDEAPTPPRLPVEIYRNGDWLHALNMPDMVRLCARYTVARMLERDDFDKRFKAGQPISVHELIYPLSQGFDSVMIRSDLELGATEQKFNLLVGRALQEDYARGEMPWCDRYIPEAVRRVPVPRGQEILTLPILVGTDGVQRMSKSLGNYVGVSEPPNIMYEKLMRVPDGCLESYLRLVAEEGAERVEALGEAARAAAKRAEGLPAEASAHVLAAHRGLAQLVVRMYHGLEAAQTAAASYGQAAHGRPAQARVVELPATEEPSTWIGYVAVKSGLAKSTSEARTLLRDGGYVCMPLASDGTAQEWRKADAELQVPSARGAHALLLRKGKRQETTVEVRWV